MTREARDWLPPGQTATAKFPVVGEKEPSLQARDLERWRLRLEGLVEEPLELTYDEVLALPRAELITDIHCVTGWSRRDARFEGFPLAVLLRRARPLATARFVSFEAWSPRLHDTSLPLQLALHQTWLVYGHDGERLELEHGFPLRALTPSRYFYKSLKWVHRVELLAEDHLGFWERESSYHNVGDPWPGDQRFTTGSLRPERLDRFKKATSFAAWRGKVLLSADLRGWHPGGPDLRDLQLKNCDLRGAEMAGVDLRGANLSLSDLRGANLRGADLRGADVEGADFSGADLRDADFRNTLLSATRFFVPPEEGLREAARVDGLRWEGASGLLEDQEAFLLAGGCQS